MQALLLKYSDGCFNSLINNLTTAREDSSVEVVHRLRLCIKRIRALLTVVGLKVDSTQDSLILKTIDALFLHSGYFRDIQIQIILLESYRAQVGDKVDILIGRINKEKRKIQKQLIDRFQQINHFDIILFNQHLDDSIEALDNKALEENCQLQVDQLIENIVLSSTNNPNEKMLHRIRITLKEVIYTLSLMKKGKVSIKYDVEFIKFLNSLQQNLGFWHDLVVLLNRIIDIEKYQVRFSILLWRVETDKEAIQKEIIYSLDKLREMCEKYK